MVSSDTHHTLTRHKRKYPKKKENAQFSNIFCVYLKHAGLKNAYKLFKILFTSKLMFKYVCSIIDLLFTIIKMHAKNTLAKPVRNRFLDLLNYR